MGQNHPRVHGMFYSHKPTEHIKEAKEVHQKLKTYGNLPTMAILNGQEGTANKIPLPSPAAFPSFKARCAKKTESSKTSAEENEVIHLPESNVVDPQHARDSLFVDRIETRRRMHVEPGSVEWPSWTDLEQDEIYSRGSYPSQVLKTTYLVCFEDPIKGMDSPMEEFLWRYENESLIRALSRLVISPPSHRMIRAENTLMDYLRASIRNENRIRLGLLDSHLSYMQGLQCNGVERILVVGSEKHEQRELLIGGICGKVRVPPMDPVWITGQNMTLEEKTWEHFLFCYDRGNGLHNFESVNLCINPIALCDGNITLKFIKDIVGIDYGYNVEINVKRPLKNATVTGSQSDSFKMHQCENSQGSTELHSVADSGEDFDIPVREKDGSYISKRGDKGTSFALFMSDIIGLICKQRSSTVLLVTAILLLCGSAKATDVSQENKPHGFVKENMFTLNRIHVNLLDYHWTAPEVTANSFSQLVNAIPLLFGPAYTTDMSQENKTHDFVKKSMFSKRAELYDKLNPDWAPTVNLRGCATPKPTTPVNNTTPYSSRYDRQKERTQRRLDMSQFSTVGSFMCLKYAGKQVPHLDSSDKNPCIDIYIGLRKIVKWKEVDERDFSIMFAISLQYDDIMERSPQASSPFFGLENKFRKLTMYLEMPHECFDYTMNGGRFLLLEFSQMVSLVCYIITLVKLLVSDKMQSKLENEYMACQYNIKTLFLAASTLFVVIIKIQSGSEQKKFEMSTPMSLQMVFCPTMYALFNCLIMVGKTSVYKPVKKTTYSTGPLCEKCTVTFTWFRDKSIIATVMTSTELHDLLPPVKIFEDSFNAKCKAETQIDYLSQTCSATPHWYRNVDPVKSEYTTNTGSTRQFTFNQHDVFLGIPVPYLSLILCLAVGLLFNLHDSPLKISCKDAGNEITVPDSQGNSADAVDEVNVFIEADEENSVDNVENIINVAVRGETFVSKDDEVSNLIEADSGGNDGDNIDESQKKEELLSNDENDTIITSTDNYLAEYNEQSDSLSLAGNHRLDNSFVMFLYEFKSKFSKHLVRKKCLEYWAEVTESVEKYNIDYDEEAFDAVGISLKINNFGEMYPSRYTFNNKNDRKTLWVLSEDFEEMSCAVFSAAITPTNEMRFNSSKTVEVIEQSCSNNENFEGSKYKLAIDDDKQIRAVGDEVSSCSTGLATLVTDYFKCSQQRQNSAAVGAEGNSNFIGTYIKEAESLNERLCYRKKINPSEKNENLDNPVDHNGNMTEIRAMSLVHDLTDLPFPRIDTSYLRALVYRIEEPLLAVIDRLASDNPPTPHISMRYELLRFCTLRTYPRGDKPYLIRLAAAGFYYASDGDGVVCYCCGSRRYNWTGREDPMKVHQGIKPSCKFLTKNEDVNVPVVCNGPWSKSLIGIEAIPEPNVITQEVENVNREYAPERQRNQESVNEQHTLGINNATPKHSQYTIKSQRLGSYKDWPKTSKLKPEELADAGFFHAGFGDCVRCFFCGIGLRHWSDDDDPWIEHARWARTCVFVRQKKGEEFVNLVQLAVQLTQDNGQAGATVEGSGNKNSVPVTTIEKLLLSKAALSAAELGFHTEIIKRAVEEMIRNGVTDNISPDDLLCQVLEIEGRDERAAAATAGTAASRDTNKGNGSENKTSVSSSAEPSKEEKANGDEKTKTDNTKKQSDKTEKTKLDKGNDSDSLQDPVAIKHENEVLKEQTLCKVCLDNTVCIVFLPCGHLVTCADCAPAMRKCPICRALVRGTVRTYMS